MQTVRLAALVAFLGVWGASQATAGNLVLNGGFETGDFTDWTLGGNNDGFTGVSTADPNSGNYAADIGTYGSDITISQSIAVNPSTTYDIGFYLAQGFDPDPSNGYTNDFSASFDGQTLLSQTNAPASPYQQYTFSVTTGPTDTSAVLEFAGYNDADYFHLDDVTASTPEPASLLLLAAGLALFLVVKVRARRPLRA